MTDPKKPDEQKDKDPKNENNQKQPQSTLTLGSLPAVALA